MGIISHYGVLLYYNSARLSMYILCFAGNFPGFFAPFFNSTPHRVGVTLAVALNLSVCACGEWLVAPARQRPCLSPWERWPKSLIWVGEGVVGEGICRKDTLSVKNRLKRADFCQLSQRESQGRLRRQSARQTAIDVIRYKGARKFRALRFISVRDLLFRS